MKVSVDRTQCTGHARCHSINSELFTLDDVGYSSLESAEVPPGFEDDVRQAVANCPERAISVAE